MAFEFESLLRAALAGPRAYGEPVCSGCLRVRPEDFIVDEDLGYAPDGHGQHVLLRIRKRNVNTEWLSRNLARFAAVPGRSVAYAGLKDRHALTSQWLSVDLSGQAEPDWRKLNDENIEVLQVARHRRKLRRGALRGNDFRITLRKFSGVRDAVSSRLLHIACHGVPNYFAEQRFGRDGGNLRQARDMLLAGRRVKDRHKRGLYLSAARALLFNAVLAQRVAAGTWNRALPGELLILDGTRSYFAHTDEGNTIEQRIACCDLHPSGPLWGRGDRPVEAAAGTAETHAMSAWRDWCVALERAGLEAERRPLRVRPRRLGWRFEDDRLVLYFSLPPGSYATAVVRELCTLTPADT